MFAHFIWLRCQNCRYLRAFLGVKFRSGILLSVKDLTFRNSALESLLVTGFVFMISTHCRRFSLRQRKKFLVQKLCPPLSISLEFMGSSSSLSWSMSHLPWCPMKMRRRSQRSCRQAIWGDIWKQVQSVGALLPLMQAIWIYICKYTVEKNQINATNANTPFLRQAIWGHTW